MTVHWVINLGYNVVNIFKYMYFFLCVSENWSSEPWYSMEDLLCLFFFQIIEALNLSDDERESWRCAFYHGPAFPTMSKILLGSKCTHQTYHCMLLLSMLPPVTLKHFWHSNHSATLVCQLLLWSGYGRFMLLQEMKFMIHFLSKDLQLKWFKLLCQHYLKKKILRRTIGLFAWTLKGGIHKLITCSLPELQSVQLWEITPKILFHCSSLWTSLRHAFVTFSLWVFICALLFVLVIAKATGAHFHLIFN